jgi:hypothetical protein
MSAANQFEELQVIIFVSQDSVNGHLSIDARVHPLPVTFLGRPRRPDLCAYTRQPIIAKGDTDRFAFV